MIFSTVFEMFVYTVFMYVRSDGISNLMKKTLLFVDMKVLV